MRDKAQKVTSPKAASKVLNDGRTSTHWTPAAD
jgi:hypothetical protein